ncbi:MAG TPA: hypothetical protein VMP10_02960 [Chloroflexota bacterium]|nr:hypothetical protein [Chloroflexota bacterium]
MEVIALIRDIVIILMGLMFTILLAVLVFVAWKAYRLFGYIREQVPDFVTIAKNTATTAQDTATSVQGTTNFLGEVAVTPVIRFVALIVAIQRFFAVLFRGTSRTA